MRMIEVLTIASLLLLPGAIAPAYAEEKQPEQKQQQAKPAPQQQRAQQQAKPAPQQQRAQQQAKPAPQQQRAQQKAKPAPQQQRAQQQAKPAPQQQRAQQKAKPAPQQQRAQQPAKPAQLAAGHGRIPDDRFRASFGRGHTFHVNRSDFAGGSRRFQYGGFWFAMVNPWPAAWLYTDNVYVDYINGGYFLCDPVHPGVYLSITVG